MGWYEAVVSLCYFAWPLLLSWQSIAKQAATASQTEHTVILFNIQGVKVVDSLYQEHLYCYLDKEIWNN
jgi:hypothetical protein